MKFDIISVGSATLDIFLKSSEFPLSAEMIGKKVEVEEHLLSSGGGGSNTAAGFSRLGLKTALIARFGDDLFGEFVRQDLEKESFDKQFLLQKKGDVTDCSTILVSPDGSRIILVYRGKTKVDEMTFPWEALDQTEWLYLASLEGNVDLLTEVTGKAVQKGIKMALNPGGRELKQKEKLMAIFPQVKVLVLNTEEAKLFTQEEEDERVFEKIRTVGPEIVVVTAGRKGSHLFYQTQHLFAPPFIGEVVDESGAGDAFSSGFVSGLAKGLSLPEALKLGMANGFNVVTKIGCKTGLLGEGDIQHWLGQNLTIEQKS